MSKLSDLSVQIQEMLESGMEPETIARVLEVPVSWVFVELDLEIGRASCRERVSSPV